MECPGCLRINVARNGEVSMKWVLIFVFFNGLGGAVDTPAAIQQEFGSQKACNDARTILNARIPNSASFCFPLD